MENGESEPRALRVRTLVKGGMPGEWRIENQNRELRVRTFVKGGMLGEWRMENQNRELRVQTLCQRRHNGRMENAESETRLGVALTGRIYRFRIR